MAISNPFGGHKVGYQPVGGAISTGIPKQYTFPGASSGNPVFARLNELFAAYHDPMGNSWRRLAVLGDLYFTTDYALKKAGKKDPAFVPAEADVMALYKTVVDSLCKAFDCSVNVLPARLEEWWGRMLTKHGEHVDSHPNVARYLTRAEVEKYRLRFAGSMVYMRDRAPGNMGNIANPRWVPANSSGIGWTDGRGTAAPAMMYPGYAGFALSMSREFYMAHHRGCFNKDNFFHSSYLSGDSVLCTGTIEIVNGRVVGVANDSGHYQPSLDHLLNVAQTLRMQGCSLSSIIFHAMKESIPASVTNGPNPPPGQWYQHGGRWWLAVNGDTLLQLRSGGGGISDRYRSNQQNIAWKLPQGAMVGGKP